MTYSLPAETHMGRVALSVANLGQSLSFYSHHIGLQVRARDDAAATAVLGTPERDLLILHEQRNGRHMRGVSGLYHFALLVPSRLELARTLQHLADTGTTLSGFADHAVSEAIYLSDPDGHGIEIYRDRPRNEWEYPDGQLKLTVDPFDFDGVLGMVRGKSYDWGGLHSETVMGHVHLHVAHIPASRQFYNRLLGFDVMARYGAGALFVAAGGYHHHLGLNTWAGVGAPPPPDSALRLLWYEICLPSAAALSDLADRLRAAGVDMQRENGRIILRDPAQNVIHLTTNPES